MSDDDAAGGDTEDDPSGLVECPACHGSGKSDGEVTVRNGCVICLGQGRVRVELAVQFLDATRKT